MVVLGDWNAHLGIRERPDDDPLIGTVLGSFETNCNGALMRAFVELHRLEVMTTKLDRSCRITWTRGDLQSQIDHILRRLPCRFFIDRLKGVACATLSDHKLVRCRIRNIPNLSAETAVNRTTYRSARKKWDLTLLGNEAIQKNYQEQLTRQFENYNYTSNSTRDWHELVKVVSNAATETLSKRKRRLDHSPESKRFVESFKRAKFEVSENPTNETRQRLKDARINLYKHRQQRQIDGYRVFFENLTDYHVSERIKKTYSFIRLARKPNNPNTPELFISMRQWEEELSSTEGPDIDYIEEELP